jgi:hypothetical protein
MAPKVRSQMKCGLCGLTGHNRRTCRQLNQLNQLNSTHSESMAPKVRSQMKCGLCGLTGHNRRTCRQLNPVVCCSPEYSGITLCDDMFEMIGSQVKIVREKEIVDYWEDLNMQSKSLDCDCGPNAWEWLAMDRGLRKFYWNSSRLDQVQLVGASGSFYGFYETCFNRKRIIEIIDIALIHDHFCPGFGLLAPPGIPETPPPIVWIHRENWAD